MTTAKKKSTKKSDHLSVGVVGCGYWGPNLIRSFNSLPGCTVQAVCDTRPERLDHMKSLYPEVETNTSFNWLLNGPNLDAIAIAAPLPLHYDLASQCIDASKHTFIEKPMASSSHQCQELTGAAADKSLSLMVGHTFLYSAAVRKMKEIIDAGDIGKIRYISSRRLNLGILRSDLNVVWDLAPHDISIIMYLMNELPDSVNCQGQANLNKDVADVATLTMNFPSGVFATIQNSWLDPRKVREMTIVGEKRMIVYDDLEPVQKIKIYDQRVESPPHYDTFTDFHYSYHYGDMYAPHIQLEEPLRVECNHFLDCIRGGSRPLTWGGNGKALVQILEAASESLAREGGRVTISDNTAKDIFGHS